MNFDCPHCGQNIDAVEDFAGLTLPCPTCGGMIELPGDSDPSDPSDQADQADQADEGGDGTCEWCGLPMEPEAVLCTECGYDRIREVGVESDWQLRMDDSNERLRQAAYCLDPAGWFEPPAGKQQESILEFTRALNAARTTAMKVRAEWRGKRKLTDQGHSWLDGRVSGKGSLGILFRLDELAGVPPGNLLKCFFRTCAAGDLSLPISLFGGPFIGMAGAGCLAVSSDSPRLLARILEDFSESSQPGLFPEPYRFLRTPFQDGHLLPRTFSLPALARVRGHAILPPADRDKVPALSHADLQGTSWYLEVG